MSSDKINPASYTYESSISVNTGHRRLSLGMCNKKLRTC
jgi:hypothetical protein